MRRRSLGADPLDIAPHAPRHPPAAWWTLAVGAVLFLGGGATLATSLHSLQRAHDAKASAEQRSREEAARVAAARALLAQPAAAAHTQAAQKLSRFARVSWFGLFDALESASQAVEGTVTLVSLAPAAADGHAGLTEIHLSALAVTGDKLLTYARALRSDPRVARVELASHQAEERVAAGAVRANLILWWNLAQPAQLPEAQASAAMLGGAVVQSSASKAGDGGRLNERSP